MKILYIIPELHLGGAERQMLVLASALVEAGHTVRILALRPARRPFPFASTLDIHTLPGVSSGSPRVFTAVWSQVRRVQPDVVHTWMFGFDLLAALAARLAGVPCVISSRRELATWQQWPHRLLQGAANGVTDAVIANSLAAADYACLHEASLHRGMVYTIPNAYQPRTGAPDEAIALPTKPALCVVNIANFWPAKGHATLIRAFAMFRNAVPNASLWLVGKGPEAPALQALVRALDLTAHVVFLEQRHDIDRILANADLYVHSSEMESSPNAILEAMGAGIPVVAVACGGIPELLHGGDLGLLVGDKTPESLAAGMRHVALHPAESRARASAALIQVRERHAAPRIAAQHLSVYTLARRTSLADASAVPVLALYTLGDLVSPSARYRCLQFIPAFQAAGWRVRHYGLPTPTGGRWRRALTLIVHGPIRLWQWHHGAEGDTHFVQKGLTPARWRGMTRLLKRHHARLLVDLDDAVHLTFPITMPRPWRWAQDPAEPLLLIREAAGLLVGNTRLRGGLPPHQGTVSVVPTVLDCTRYINGSWRLEDADNRAPFRLLWVGQRSTLPYLLGILPALIEVARRLQPRGVHLLVVCDAFSGLDPSRCEPLVITRRPWNLEDEVTVFQEADVGLMPLPDNEWTRAKCGFKLLQYMASSLPAVASPVGVNAEIIQNGVNGFLAADAQAWITMLLRLAASCSLRAMIGSAARERVREGYSLAVWRDMVVQQINAVSDVETTEN